jgi:hypothetical protein
MSNQTYIRRFRNRCDYAAYQPPLWRRVIDWLLADV